MTKEYIIHPITKKYILYIQTLEMLIVFYLIYIFFSYHMSSTHFENEDVF